MYTCWKKKKLLLLKFLTLSLPDRTGMDRGPGLGNWWHNSSFQSTQTGSLNNSDFKTWQIQREIYIRTMYIRSIFYNPANLNHNFPLTEIWSEWDIITWQSQVYERGTLHKSYQVLTYLETAFYNTDAERIHGILRVNIYVQNPTPYSCYGLWLRGLLFS